MGHCGTPWEGVKVPGPGTPSYYALHCIAGGAEVDHVQSASKMFVRCWKQLNCEGYRSSIKYAQIMSKGKMAS